MANLKISSSNKNILTLHGRQKHPPHRSDVTFLTLIHETKRNIVFLSCFLLCFSLFEVQPDVLLRLFLLLLLQICVFQVKAASLCRHAVVLNVQTPTRNRSIMLVLICDWFLFSVSCQGSRGLQGKTGEPGAQGREVRGVINIITALMRRKAE